MEGKLSDYDYNTQFRVNDKNRVCLKWSTLDEEQKLAENVSDYINASHIGLPGTTTRYIAAQAPLPSTLRDWFEMIREYEVRIIVMLCNIIEMGKVKCEMYWPQELNEEENFAGIFVTVIKEEIFEEYSKRDLKLRWKDGEIKYITQLHYTEWPDHGSPQSELQFLDMIYSLDKLLINDPDKPVLVHCSAGCGRTGTIIAANSIRERINKEILAEELNILEITLELRKQRVSMIQTPDQYQFLHKVVLRFCKEKLNAEDKLSKMTEILNGVISIKDLPLAPSPSALIFTNYATSLFHYFHVKNKTEFYISSYAVQFSSSSSNSSNPVDSDIGINDFILNHNPSVNEISSLGEVASESVVLN
ncbi:unnamed protein product [Dracunculus medinensis]|uniref:Tyrosine-protein phosphatase domain-containing protein n=1 Tax=Dracunculus medinensis TaxID=318479 RepID=A0A158Q3M0_DRAME|nr:unnamed protein product [Dracunculus medinensis]